MYKYILEGHTPVPCEDLLKWARWFEEADEERIVAQDQFSDSLVSTVFLALDHGLPSSVVGDPPSVLLFETMVFGGRFDQHQERCSTWGEAEEQHARVKAMVLAHPNEPER